MGKNKLQGTTKGNGGATKIIGKKSREIGKYGGHKRKLDKEERVALRDIQK